MKLSTSVRVPSGTRRRWMPPPDGVPKLNCDGAVAKTQKWQNQGAVGVICRYSQGSFMGASAVVFDRIKLRRVLMSFPLFKTCRLGN
jgi:hypothetical protein